MDFSGTNTVFAITTICYTIGMVANCFPKICEDCIPIVMSVTGALLGIAGMFLIKDFPAQDIINAIAVGIASGLSATGIHQMGKQTKQTKG
ncbi:MAG TPA: phage holin family protein [Candidatus Fimimorpha faecalis]|uniref:Phage holin family protein n=1 Tax=Candidatus Fimimorpha faecalis TaxID=2840824 RepID=A0A9D1JDT1_9FIRM|nr:phage holin family protein [Candidatus Fimimorpha faecalis]